MAASNHWRDALDVAARLVRIALAAQILAVAPSLALADPRLPPPGTGAWRELTFPSIRRTTAYTSIRMGEADAVLAHSRCSASALLLPLESLDLDRTPVLAWRWRVDRHLEVEDERTRDGDDFAARVYVLFRFEPDRATFAQRWRHKLGRLLYASEPPGSALNFVWASRVPVGESWPNPRSAESRMVVQASGAGDGWRQERADIPLWYERSFDRPPPPVLALALMSDSDDTCQDATAVFSDLQFVPRDP